MNYDPTPNEVYNDWWRNKDQQIKAAYESSLIYQRQQPHSAAPYYATYHRFLTKVAGWSTEEAKRVIERAYPTKIVQRCKCQQLYIWQAWLYSTTGGMLAMMKWEVPGIMVSTHKYFCSEECAQQQRQYWIDVRKEQQAQEAKRAENARKQADEQREKLEAVPDVPVLDIPF